MTTWTYHVLWCMQEWLKRKGPSKGVEILEQGHIMDVLRRICLKYKTSLDLRRGFLIKYPPCSQKLVVIGCLNINSRRERVLIHQPRSQLVECVARSTMVIASWGRIIALVVARVVTRWEIIQSWRSKQMLVGNIKQVVQIRHQRRTAFMLFALGVSNWLLLMWWSV